MSKLHMHLDFILNFICLYGKGEEQEDYAYKLVHAFTYINQLRQKTAQKQCYIKKGFKRKFFNVLFHLLLLKT